VLSPSKTDQTLPINLHESLVAVATHVKDIMKEEYPVPDSPPSRQVIDVDEEIIQIFDSPIQQKEACSIPRGKDVQSTKILAHCKMRDFTYPTRRWIPASSDRRNPPFQPDPNEEVDPDLPQNSKVQPKILIRQKRNK
jgi:hypothetical protein